MVTLVQLQILSLDGGGVKVISSLYMLKELMAQVKRQNRVDHPNEPLSALRPCDVFDLICGTSTGGLIALMLGRLEMVRYNPRAPSISMTRYLLNSRLSMKPSPNI